MLFKKTPLPLLSTTYLFSSAAKKKKSVLPFCTASSPLILSSTYCRQTFVLLNPLKPLVSESPLTSHCQNLIQAHWHSIAMLTTHIFICLVLSSFPDFELIYPAVYATSLLGCLLCVSDATYPKGNSWFSPHGLAPPVGFSTSGDGNSNHLAGWKLKVLIGSCLSLTALIEWARL